MLNVKSHLTGLNHNRVGSWCFPPAANVTASSEHRGRADEDRVDPAEQSLLNKMIRHSLVRNRNQVEVLQSDPTSPLYSVRTFEELRL